MASRFAPSAQKPEKQHPRVWCCIQQPVHLVHGRPGEVPPNQCAVCEIRGAVSCVQARIMSAGAPLVCLHLIVYIHIPNCTLTQQDE